MCRHINLEGVKKMDGVPEYSSAESCAPSGMNRGRLLRVVMGFGCKSKELAQGVVYWAASGFVEGREKEV